VVTGIGLQRTVYSPSAELAANDGRSNGEVASYFIGDNPPPPTETYTVVR